MNNSTSNLQRLFNSLMLANYGSSKTIKLPFFGGYLELCMEYTDGMIRLMGVNAMVLGVKCSNHNLKLGYTGPVSLARDVNQTLENLKLQGISAAAHLARSANDHVSLKASEQVHGV